MGAAVGFAGAHAVTLLPGGLGATVPPIAWVEAGIAWLARRPWHPRVAWAASAAVLILALGWLAEGAFQISFMPI